MSLRLRLFPVIASMAVCLAAPAGAAELAAVLPEDAIVFSELRSVQKLSAVENHPIVERFLKSEAGGPLKELLEAFRKESDDSDAKFAEKFEEEVGIPISDFLAKFNGSAAIGAGLSVAKLIDGELGPEDAGILAAADFSGDEELVGKVIDLIRKETEVKSEDHDEDDDEDEDAKPWAAWPDEYEESVTDVEGATVHEWGVKNPDRHRGIPAAWTIAGGRLIAGTIADDVKEAARRQQRDSQDGSLAASPYYRAIEESAGEWDFLAGVNLESLLSGFRDGLRKKMESGDLNSPVPVNPLQIWNAFGLDNFRTASLAFDLQDEVLDSRVAVTYDGLPAVLKLYAASGPGEAPLFAPVDADDVNWGTFDPGTAFDALKEIAAAGGPMLAGGLEMALNTAKTKSGVDIRNDLLGRMGPNLWTITSVQAPAAAAESKSGDDEDDEIPMPEQSTVYGLSLRDARAFELSLTSLVNSFAPGKALFDDREFLGSTIHRLREIPPPMEISWLIRDDTLVVSIGKPELLEKILGGMEKRPAEPLLTREHIRRAFDRLPEGHISSGVTDPSFFVTMFLAGAKSGVDTVEGGLAGASPLSEALAKLPETIEFPALMISRTYLDNRALSVRALLIPKP